jgi:hypothetical protein
MKQETEMKSKWIQHYGQMLTDIWLCRQKQLEKIEEVECCFQIAEKYRVRLIEMVSAYEFECTDEEIYFFKKVKPQFTAEIEYLGLCNYVELFKTGVKDDDTSELEKFYKKELQRIEKFGHENPVFYQYVKERKADMDKEWFTREERNHEKPELKTRSSSLYDHLMGSYLALEKYTAFIKTELENLIRRTKGEPPLPKSEFKW